MIATDTKVIHAGTLLADAGEAPKRQQSLLIEGSRIKSVASGFIDPPDGASLVDLSDKFVLPGLIDCHVHLTGQFGPKVFLEMVQDSEPKTGFKAAHYAALTLGAGFTTVRDVGAFGSPDIIFALRDAIADGLVDGPRILCVGMILGPTGGHGQVFPYREEVCACVHSTAGRCDGVDACRRAVRQQVAFGADAIKFVATGGVLTDTKTGLDQQFFREEIESIIETAHALGRPVAAHAHSAAGINAALEAGVDSIEHGSFLDDRSIELFLEKGAFHVPTLIAGMAALEMSRGPTMSSAQADKARQVAAEIKNALGRSYKAGVRIAFGTDAAVAPHGINGREFGLMAEAGMSAKDCLVAATLNAAELLGIADEVGTLEAGKSADIIAVDASPLEDVTILESVKFVMARGSLFKG
ncbi:metal-dependent hydrolase family protein [Sphingosinicella rhizophila]|uniref:Amidohydrolase family protein n=1 Tax=Sphingosinicella rhizophila TaxID=3050082 RepID=A0ABU3Q6M8_9SPHN|nr:amidohydrolase family protein [Sphingosinicella sp. GR2756]MDT9598744.1 amidohydrolase family protein [Sphingosinicella sp. GR2756]